MKLVAAAFAGALILAGCSDGDSTTRTEDGEIVEGGEVDVFAVQEGDCISWPTEVDAVSSFDGVACDEPHDGEIYELFDITGFDEYPGDAVVSQEADAGCKAAFEPFVGIDFLSSRFFVTQFVPNQDTWDNFDDREVICILVPGEGEPQLTASLEGIAE